MFGASAAFPVFTFFFGCAGLLDIDLFLKPAPALRVFLFGVWPDSTMGLLLSEAVWSTVVSSFSLSSWSPMSAWASSSWASPSLFFFSPLASSPLGAPRDVLGCLGVPHLPLPRPLPLPLPRPRGFGLPHHQPHRHTACQGPHVPVLLPFAFVAMQLAPATSWEKWEESWNKRQQDKPKYVKKTSSLGWMPIMHSYFFAGHD